MTGGGTARPGTIELSGVTKQYGRTNAIDDLTLDIDEPGVHGLLGRNGAGKTTLMKLIAGHLRTTEGEVRVNDEPCSPRRMSCSVTLVESRASQFNLGAGDLIDAADALHEGFDLAFAQTMLRRFELDPRRRYGRLSFGMQTMVSTILGLASGTDVVMLDEPVLGFDTIMRRRFNALLRESVHRHPRIVLVSTHLMDDLAPVADRLMVIDAGRVLARAPMDDIRARFDSTDDFFLEVLGVSIDG